MLAKIHIRPATERDAGRLRALVVAGRINPTGIDWKRFVVVENEQGQVIACGQVKPHRDGSAELASIVVVDEWRGLGLARAIIEHLLRENPGELYLMCRSNLGPMYEKFGFSAIGMDAMPVYFRRVSQLAGLAEVMRKEGETLLVMRRAGG